MGFSFRGLAAGLAVLLPNILFLFFPPVDAVETRPCRRVFTLLEKAGQAGCLFFLCVEITPLVYGSPLSESGPLRAMPALLLLCYWALWVRYFIKGRHMGLLFDRVAVPVPMAVLPAAVFLLWGVLRLNLPLLAAACVFAIGHLAASLHTAGQLGQRKE